MSESSCVGSSSSGFSSYCSTTSSHDSSDEEQPSPGSEINGLSLKEIEALKQYSYSVQIFTYQLFENFCLELEAKGVTEPVGKANKTPKPRKSNKPLVPVKQLDFRLDQLSIVDSDTPPSVEIEKSPKATGNGVDSKLSHGIKKASKYPRRKRRSGPVFPEGTGL